MTKNLLGVAAISVFLVSCGGTNQGGTEYTGDGSELAAAKLFHHDGQKFSPIQMEGSPEYYILYYSASW